MAATKTFKIARVQGAPVSDAELIADLLNVASQLGQQTVGLIRSGGQLRYDASPRTGSIRG